MVALAELRAGKETKTAEKLSLLRWVGANGLNQYTQFGDQSINYDGNFNFAWIGGWQYNYDAANHLTSIGNGSGGTLVSFVYDGLGRCVKRTVNGVVTLLTYDDWKPIMEWGAWGDLQAWNIYGPGADEILWRYDARPGYGHLRYHHDIHGNVTSLLNENGAVIEKYSYDAFGAPKVTDPAGNERRLGGRFASWYGNRFLFQGREYFPELGLYDYRHRFYDPTLGRFIQSDPTGFDAGDMNLFRYCGDDPVDRSDPDGLMDRSANSDIWRHLTDFYNGNPSMDLARDVWNQQWSGGLTMAPIGLSKDVQVPSRPRDSDGSALPVYDAALAAARSREEGVGSAVKTVKTTEVISEVGQAQDGSARYVAIKPHVGIGTHKAWSGKAQQSIGDARNLPLGYQHLVGFVLGHVYYDGRFVDHDIGVAKASNYKVAIIIGEILGKGNKSVIYEKGKPDPIY